MLINIVTDHFAGAAGCMLPRGALAVLLMYLGGFLHFALSERRSDDIGDSVVLQACLAMFAQQLLNMPMNASSQQQHIVAELLSVGRTCFRANMTTLIRPIRVLAPTLKSFPVWQQRATEYQALTGIPVVLEGVPFSSAGPEVILELQSSPLRDGWILAPEITGTVALYEGFADLGPLIRQVPESMMHYNDFLPFYRLVSGVYNKKIIGLPMDGDNFLLYYRQAQRVAACSPAALLDLFQRYQLDVPQTWSDLLDMARLMNGTDTDGDGRPDLFGACLDMMPQCKISFYVAGIAASYVQNNGTQSGFWFDPDSDGSLMRPLVSANVLPGCSREARRLVVWDAAQSLDCELVFMPLQMGNTEAMRAVLQLLLDLQPYMPRDLTCADSHPVFQAGSCLMTFDWGGVFRATRSSNISRPGMLGIAPLPGSTQILDRTTLKLVNCTPALCPMAQPYRTTRVAPNVTRTLPGAWVNTAPFAAFGGWTAGVAASSPPEVQLATLNFFAYLTSPRNSWEDVLNPVGAVDPFRQQHLDPANIDRWTAAGFDASSTLQYLFALRAAMSSPNLALDTRLAYSLKHSEDKNYRQLLEAAYLAASTAKGNLTNTLKATEENFLQLEKDAVQLLTTADPLELRQQYWYLLGRVASVFAPPSPLPQAQSPGISRDRVTIIAVCLVAGLLLLLGLGLLAWQRVVWLRRNHRSALGKLLPPGAGPDTTLVLTDVQDSTTLYESLPVEVMDACMRIAERIIRDLLAAHQGYESATEGDAFLCAFHSPLDAVLFCLKLQDALLHATWPQELLHCSGVPCCHLVTVSLSPHFNKIVQVLGPPLLPKLPAPQSSSDPDAQQPLFRYTHAETDGPPAVVLSNAFPPACLLASHQADIHLLDLSDLLGLLVPAPSSDGLEAGAQGSKPAHLPSAFLGSSQPRDSMTAAAAQAMDVATITAGKAIASLLFHPWMRQPQKLAQEPPPLLYTPEDWLARSGALTQDLGTAYSAADTTTSSQAVVALGEAGSMASRSSSRPHTPVTSLELAMETMPGPVDSDRLSSRSSISRNPKSGILCPTAAPTTLITALQQAMKISLSPVAELIYIEGQQQQHRTITSQEPSHCLVFSGLRIRCGVHTGVASAQDVSYNTSSARMQYSGAPQALARAVCDAAQGAQILLSQACFAALPQQQLRDAVSLAFPIPRASSISVKGGRAGVVHGTEVDAVGYVDVQHLPHRSLDVQRGSRTTTGCSDCGNSSVLYSVASQASAAARITNPGTLAVSVDCEMAGGSSTNSTPRPSKPGNAIPVPVQRAKDRQAGAVRGGAGSQHPKAPPLLMWHMGEYVLKVGSAAVARTTATDGMFTTTPGNQNDTPPTDHWTQLGSSDAIMGSLRDWRQQVAECPSSSIAAGALPQPLRQALPQRPELPSRGAVRRSSLALVAAEHCMSPEAAEALHSKPGQQVHSLYSVLPAGLAPRLVLLGAPRAVRQTVPGALSAPYGSACVCFLYVVGLAELLAWDPQEAASALALFSALIKQQLMAWNGYLVEHVDGFVLAAFACPVSALRWACICQEHLKQLPWSDRLLAHPLAESLITAEMGSNGEARQTLVYRGLRIKVGADVGAVRTSLHPVTGVMAFRGRVMNRAARIASRAGSGQVLCSAAVWAHWAGNSALATDGLPSRAVLGSTPELGSEGEQLLPRLTAVSQGLVPLKGVPEPVEVMQVKDAAVMNVLAIKGVETVKRVGLDCSEVLEVLGGGLWKYPGLGYKRLRDKPPKAQQQQPAVTQ
ncbi:hypothetical protein QJQ45_029838 [Haematococcus lacustris]|nr:hypothetical protein QJQ45_029838 [Haematococcus lacustris]